MRSSPTPVADGELRHYGEALYNLALDSGAYSCARCHTPGWSYGDPASAATARSAGTSPAAPSTPHFPTAKRT